MASALANHCGDHSRRQREAISLEDVKCMEDSFTNTILNVTNRLQQTKLEQQQKKRASLTHSLNGEEIQPHQFPELGKELSRSERASSQEPPLALQLSSRESMLEWLSAGIRDCQSGNRSQSLAIPIRARPGTNGLTHRTSPSHGRSTSPLGRCFSLTLLWRRHHCDFSAEREEEVYFA